MQIKNKFIKYTLAALLAVAGIYVLVVLLPVIMFLLVALFLTGAFLGLFIMISTALDIYSDKK